MKTKTGHVPTSKTRDLVKSLSLVGWTDVEIAYVLKICDETLRKHYDRELNEPLYIAGAEIAGSIYELAKNGDKDCMKFFLTHRCRWTPHKPAEKQESNNSIDYLEILKAAKAINDSQDTPNSK